MEQEWLLGNKLRTPLSVAGKLAGVLRILPYGIFSPETSILTIALKGEYGYNSGCSPGQAGGVFFRSAHRD
jgi:hypothetical protein